MEKVAHFANVPCKIKRGDKIRIPKGYTRLMKRMGQHLKEGGSVELHHEIVEKPFWHYPNIRNLRPIMILEKVEIIFYAAEK